ncbi:unnamed protein product [Choristocarpus tenellus]
MLMDASACEMPDEARKVDISSCGLVGVVDEDLKYFVNLETLDAGDNSLDFGCFSSLPILEELRLQCNNLSNIVPAAVRGYRALQRLDLSYNSLTSESLASLGILPSLRDLDLTCNGLTNLPLNMSRLHLYRLSLERNQLGSEGNVLHVLSSLPELQDLNLAYNYVSKINIDAASASQAFSSLRCLDLASNYITQEEDIMSLVLLDKLEKVILYGNPLAGPTGEDPLGLCVEALIKEADRTRGFWATKPLEVITETPCKDIKRKRFSRRRPYSDTGITMVQEKPLPSASAFRAAGNETIFSFEGNGGASRSNPTSTAHEKVTKTVRPTNGNQQHTMVDSLDQIETVLNFMGESTDAMALERRAVDTSPTEQKTQPGMSSIIKMINSVMDEI